ncbi:MAG: cyclic nucleotide-binding domain-containing protein, partial [Acidimicrobiia bacterium]|nr:cyclic nucleotide-binding domain-containing protein [Acidimicrobiia bacterium]
MTESLQARVAEALEVDLSIIETADVAIDIRDLGPEETLVERGDPVDDVFVILDGELEVHGFDDQMLAVLEPGAVVGEVAVMAGGRRTATVRAGEGAKVAVVGAQDFE